MRTPMAVLVHWILFGTALLRALWLVIVGFVELNDAFARDDLTRQTLFRGLAYLVGVLALLWAAGWIVTSRPRTAPPADFEGYTYF